MLDYFTGFHALLLGAAIVLLALGAWIGSRRTRKTLQTLTDATRSLSQGPTVRQQPPRFCLGSPNVAD